MLPLKQYQERTLDVLKRYLRTTVQLGDADLAFYKITKEEFGQPVVYAPVPQLPGLPYMCVRIPTGGGKTLLGTHAVGVVIKEFLRVDRSVVLWLVPTNTIKDQTIAALSNRNHPYRQALDTALNGNITIMDITQALYVQRGVLDGSTTIIVSTLAALRVEETDGRKVYESSGVLQHHFSGLDEGLFSTLETDEDGKPVNSLANVLRLHRPMVIVDEAHNARTSLSFDTLARFNPSCILELTATPQTVHNPQAGLYASNVLWHVSAAELKAESMVKLPIQLQTWSTWKQSLNESIQIRAQLERLAEEERKESNEYIRPIALIQAQPRYKDRESVTYEVVKKSLLDDFRIPEEWIAVATGDKYDLDDINLMDEDCPIRFVITVQQLKEGWDCPFAYVLCTVADQTSKTAVEQILGRVMRLPKARSKKHEELNQAYAVAASNKFADTAKALADALVNSGFERYETTTMIVPKSIKTPIVENWFNEVAGIVRETPSLEELSTELQNKVRYDTSTQQLFFTSQISISDLEKVELCFKSPEAKDVVKEMWKHSMMAPTGASVTRQDTLSPSQAGAVFSVPLLAIESENGFVQFDDSFHKGKKWDLSECDPSLSEEEFSVQKNHAITGQIDLSNNGKVKISFIDQLQYHFSQLLDEQEWTVSDLVSWLDRQFVHHDLTMSQTKPFLHKMISTLMTDRGFSMDSLVHEKFRLRDSVAKKVDSYREASKIARFKQLLNLNSLVVCNNLVFTYPEEYPANFLYEGQYKFQKHYYPQVGELKADGEEFECAQRIDMLPNVKYWVRNLERRPLDSFWLQTSMERFYPDFVAYLEDGRILVVEYKGLHLWTDSEEKRQVGARWEALSKGKCVFRMVNENTVENVLSSIGNS